MAATHLVALDAALEVTNTVAQSFLMLAAADERTRRELILSDGHPRKTLAKCRPSELLDPSVAAIVLSDDDAQPPIIVFIRGFPGLHISQGSIVLRDPRDSL